MYPAPPNNSGGGGINAPVLGGGLPFSNGGGSAQPVAAGKPQTSVTPSPGGECWTLDPAVGHLLNLMRRTGPKPLTAEESAAAAGVLGVPGEELDPVEEYEFLEQLLQSRELNALVKAHNVILFCNQVRLK